MKYRLLDVKEPTKAGDEFLSDRKGTHWLPVLNLDHAISDWPVRRLNDGAGKYVLLDECDFTDIGDDLYYNGKWCPVTEDYKEWQVGIYKVRRKRPEARPEQWAVFGGNGLVKWHPCEVDAEDDAYKKASVSEVGDKLYVAKATRVYTRVDEVKVEGLV